MSRPPALGRGLGALIPTTADPALDAEATVDLREDALMSVPGVKLRELATSDIVPNSRQPRSVFDEDALAELAESLQLVGFLQPVVVRPIADGYELVAGERRWRAAQLAGLDSVPALIRDTADDDLLRDALLENLHRVQLNPLEEAAAYQQLLEDFGCTQDELAKRVGRSRPAVSNSLRLLKLPSPVQRRVAAGVLSAGHARALVALEDPDQMEALATRVVAEQMSVRALEEAIALGDGVPPTQRRRPSRRTSPFQPIAEDLGDRLDTRVSITGGTRGRLVIDFASGEDLQRILAALRDPFTWRDGGPSF